MNPLRRLSKNLVPICEFELKNGNEILRVEEPSGSECPFGIVFKRPLHFKGIAGKITLPSVIERYEFSDFHYPAEAGYSCKETKHAVYGPLSGEFQAE